MACFRVHRYFYCQHLLGLSCYKSLFNRFGWWKIFVAVNCCMYAEVPHSMLMLITLFAFPAILKGLCTCWTPSCTRSTNKFDCLASSWAISLLCSIHNRRTGTVVTAYMYLWAGRFKRHVCVWLENPGYEVALNLGLNVFCSQPVADMDSGLWKSGTARQTNVCRTRCNDACFYLDTVMPVYPSLQAFSKGILQDSWRRKVRD